MSPLLRNEQQAHIINANFVAPAHSVINSPSPTHPLFGSICPTHLIFNPSGSALIPQMQLTKSLTLYDPKYALIKSYIRLLFIIDYNCLSLFMIWEFRSCEICMFVSLKKIQSNGDITTLHCMKASTVELCEGLARGWRSLDQTVFITSCCEGCRPETV